MQENHMVFEYWRDKWASEYRRLHKQDCDLLPEIRRRNENWLEECSAAEALVLRIADLTPIRRRATTTRTKNPLRLNSNDISKLVPVVDLHRVPQEFQGAGFDGERVPARQQRDETGGQHCQSRNLVEPDRSSQRPQEEFPRTDDNSPDRCAFQHGSLTGKPQSPNPTNPPSSITTRRPGPFPVLGASPTSGELVKVAVWGFIQVGAARFPPGSAVLSYGRRRDGF